MRIGIAVNLGWLTIIFGIVVASMGWQELKKMGQAPEGGSPLRTTVLVDTGIYSVVRHPQYSASSCSSPLSSSSPSTG